MAGSSLYPIVEFVCNELDIQTVNIITTDSFDEFLLNYPLLSGIDQTYVNISYINTDIHNFTNLQFYKLTNSPKTNYPTFPKTLSHFQSVFP